MSLPQAFFSPTPPHDRAFLVSGQAATTDALTFIPNKRALDKSGKSSG